MRSTVTVMVKTVEMVDSHSPNWLTANDGWCGNMRTGDGPQIEKGIFDQEFNGALIS
jgi:hypothetical protein